jgi:hypothetical protein
MSNLRMQPFAPSLSPALNDLHCRVLYLNKEQPIEVAVNIQRFVLWQPEVPLSPHAIHFTADPLQLYKHSAVSRTL